MSDCSHKLRVVVHRLRVGGEHDIENEASCDCEPASVCPACDAALLRGGCVVLAPAEIVDVLRLKALDASGPAN
jgi:hypothetical protein